MDTKGQLISKANCPAVNSSKKQTNEFVFTTIRHVLVLFLEEIEDTKKTFQNYLAFNVLLPQYVYSDVHQTCNEKEEKPQ